MMRFQILRYIRTLDRRPLYRSRYSKLDLLLLYFYCLREDFRHLRAPFLGPLFDFGLQIKENSKIKVYLLELSLSSYP